MCCYVLGELYKMDPRDVATMPAGMAAEALAFHAARQRQQELHDQHATQHAKGKATNAARPAPTAGGPVVSPEMKAQLERLRALHQQQQEPTDP